MAKQGDLGLRGQQPAESGEFQSTPSPRCAISIDLRVVVSHVWLCGICAWRDLSQRCWQVRINGVDSNVVASMRSARVELARVTFTARAAGLAEITGLLVEVKQQQGQPLKDRPFEVRQHALAADAQSLHLP